MTGQVRLLQHYIAHTIHFTARGRHRSSKWRFYKFSHLAPRSQNTNQPIDKYNVGWLWL